MGDEVGKLDAGSYVRAFRKRARREERALDARRREALVVARRLARVLLSEFGATSVYLFGSTATGQHYRFESDIDLAVAGIAPEQEIHTHAEMNLVASPGFVVDMLFLEDAPEIFKDRVRKEGVLLGQRE